MKFSNKDFFSKYDQIRRNCGLATFTEEILNGKLHFWCSAKRACLDTMCVFVSPACLCVRDRTGN